MPLRVGFALCILSACAVAHESLEVEASGVVNKRLVRREKRDASTFYIGPDGFPDAEDAANAISSDSDTNIAQPYVEVHGETIGHPEERDSDLETSGGLKPGEGASSGADVSQGDQQAKSVEVQTQTSGEGTDHHSQEATDRDLLGGEDEQEPVSVPVANAASLAPASSAVPPAQTGVAVSPSPAPMVPGVTASPSSAVIDQIPVVVQPVNAVPGSEVAPVVAGPQVPSGPQASVAPQQADVPTSVEGSPGGVTAQGQTASPQNTEPLHTTIPTAAADAPSVETASNTTDTATETSNTSGNPPPKSFRHVLVPIALGGVITMFGLGIVYLAIWTGKKPTSSLASRVSGYSQQRRLRDTLRATQPEGGPTAQAGESASGYAQQRRLRDTVTVRSANEAAEDNNQETVPPPDDNEQVSGRTSSYGGSRYAAQRSLRTSQNKPGSARAPSNQPEEQQEEHTW
jgi:hypothetical protein